MAEVTDNEANVALDYARLRGFIPFKTHSAAISALNSLQTSGITAEFNEQLFRLHGDNAKVVLKNPPAYDSNAEADNSVTIESAAPSIGLQVKTQFTADALPLCERTLGVIVDEGSLGIRNLQTGYKVSHPFEAVAPSIDTDHDISGIMIEKNSRNYIIERRGEDRAAVKVIQEEGAGVFTDPAEVNIEGLVTPHQEFIAELIDEY